VVTAKQEYNKKYREFHRDELNQYQKEYREQHKDKAKEYQKKYYSQNKEKWIEYNSEQKKGGSYYQRKMMLQKRWEDANPEKLKLRQRATYHRNKNKPEQVAYRQEYYARTKIEQSRKFKARYEQNKEKYLKTKKLYNIHHPELLKESKKRYLKTLRGIMKNRLYSHEYRAKSQDIRCALSVEEMQRIIERDNCCVYCGSAEHLTLDHVIPVSKKGDTISANLVLACQSCNSSKHNNEVIEWCSERGIDVPEIVREIVHGNCV